MVMNPQQPSQPRGGLLGLFDKAMKTDEDTGLSPLQNFAAALDPLILKDLRGGEGIRQQGVQRAATMSKNKTVDMLRQQGRNDLADAVMNRTIGAKEAFGVLQSEKAADLAFSRQKQLKQMGTGSKVDLTTDMKNWLQVKSSKPDLTFEGYLSQYKSPKGIQSKGVYRDSGTGDIIGEVNFDPASGQYFQLGESGERKNLDITKYSPVLDSTFGQTVPNFTQFNKLSDELATDRSSIRTFEKYMRSIGDTNEGLNRLADQFSAGAKTLLSGYFGDEYTKLSPSELNTKVAQGLLQGLIGRSRLEVVGGGVMTEQDALRIIQNLGGDVNLLQNKEVVATQIKNLLEQKMASFDRKKKVHDNAIFQIYGSQGYEPIEPYEIDMSVFNASPSLTFQNAPVGSVVKDANGSQFEYLGGDRNSANSWRQVD